MHTLCLLDIKTKEQSIENLMKGRKIYEPPRFMSTQTAADQLLKASDQTNTIFYLLINNFFKRKNENFKIFTLGILDCSETQGIKNIYKPE